MLLENVLQDMQHQGIGTLEEVTDSVPHPVYRRRVKCCLGTQCCSSTYCFSSNSPQALPAVNPPAERAAPGRKSRNGDRLSGGMEMKLGYNVARSICYLRLIGATSE